MKYGIRDGMLRLPFEKALEEAKRLGFDGVEVTIGSDHKAHKLWSESGLAEIRELSAKIGIETNSLSPGGFTSYTFANPDAAKREEGKNLLRHLIRIAPEVGADVILVPFFGDGKILPEHITSPLLIEGIKEVAEVAEAHGIYLALESTLNAKDHLRIIEQVKSPMVKVYYDTGNATGFGYNAPEEIRTLKDAIIQIHIKDTDGKQPGEGRVNFDEVRKAIKEVGYDRYLVLETPSGDDPSGFAARNLKFMKEKI
jgi:sugar phosphate isomerase/epimerase